MREETEGVSWHTCWGSLYIPTLASIPSEAMMHFLPVSNSPLFPKYFQTPLKIFPISPFHRIYMYFTYFMCFSFPPSLTMMHLYIIQCTYWAPLYTHVSFINHVLHMILLLGSAAVIRPINKLSSFRGHEITYPPVLYGPGG